MEERKEKREDGQNHPFLIHESISRGENRLSVPLNWHEEMELLYFQEGRFHLMLNLEEYEIEGECLFFINPGMLRRIEAKSEGAAEYSIRFDLDMLTFQKEDRAEERILRPLREGKLSFPQHVGISDLGNREVLQQMKEILHRFRSVGERCPSIRGSERLVLSSAFDQLLLKAELLKLIGLMDSYGLIRESRQTVQDKQVRVIKKAIQYIEENYRSKIYIRDLAELTELNEQYFIRFFKRVMGMPPLVYINQFRIRQAMRLLRESSDKAYEVAEQCGFHNIGNFIKIFRSVTGVTPHEWREGASGRETP